MPFTVILRSWRSPTWSCGKAAEAAAVAALSLYDTSKAFDRTARIDGLRLLEKRGGKMVGFAGYRMPVNYALGVLKEHLHTRAAAGIFDVSHMGQAKLRGADVDLSRLQLDGKALALSLDGKLAANVAQFKARLDLQDLAAANPAVFANERRLI